MVLLSFCSLSVFNFSSSHAFSVFMIHIRLPVSASQSNVLLFIIVFSQNWPLFDLFRSISFSCAKFMELM